MSVIGQPIGAGCPVANLPPYIISVDPGKVIQGSTAKRVTVAGRNLSGASVSTSIDGIAISGVSSTDTWLSFYVTVDLAVPIGGKQFTVTTINGSVSFYIDILDATYPGGIFTVFDDVYVGAVWGVLIWGIDSWGISTGKEWVRKPIYVSINGTRYHAKIYRYDSTLNGWLLIDTTYPQPMSWGINTWTNSDWTYT